ncbi:alpha/beta hydrolase [Lentzea sp. BCCO 10_0061]|uniref:Alpha/beta hydrolase n=1 Tax=Lentzea sokolovensis TaxID=3095429 RepID=A0ABU4V9K2_9PSEU|nr:alpha/beta hydrolase [Lentzea sp. BCCO 10_0061]MDX8148482.1 alpha/beta hydrolase [Lentzea sp. BCCO 10_0061]
MRFTSETTSADGTTARDFVHDGVPGVLWTPAGTPSGLVLSAHGGGQHKRAPGITARAARCAAAGLAVVTLDAPGHGDRPRTTDDERFATEIRSRITSGHDAGALVAEYNALQAARAIPEWRSVLDALPATGESVGFWGVSMGAAIGIPLAAAEPRVRTAVFGLIGATEPLTEAAARITASVRFLLQWDDQLIARDAGLALFDAFATRQKSLHANPGGHGEVPEHELAGAVTLLAG